MPLTIASPSPAPAVRVVDLGGPSGVRALAPRQATSKTRARSPSGMPAALVADAQLDAARARARPADLDGAVGRGVPDRVHDQVATSPARARRASAATSTPSSTLPPSRTLRARATGSAPAIASLTRSPSSTGSRAEPEHAGVDPGQLEEVVDHPDHPVDLGADLPVVARRGRRRCRPRAPRSSPACRPAGCAGRGRPTRPARGATPPAARSRSRDSSSRSLVRRQLGGQRLELAGTARPATHESPWARSDARLRAAPRDQRETPRRRGERDHQRRPRRRPPRRG